MMLIASCNVPGKSVCFRIEVEMLDTGQEPLPPRGSGLPWKVMDSERGHDDVRFYCRISDTDARRTFAKSDKPGTPYEVADFARTQIQGYFGSSDDGDDEPGTPQDAPQGEALVAAHAHEKF